MINRRKRVLFTTEFTGLHTGYANYYRELMTELEKSGKYELAELASYCRLADQEHQRLISQTPWKVLSVMPNNEAEENEYRTNPVVYIYILEVVWSSCQDGNA